MKKILLALILLASLSTFSVGCMPRMMGSMAHAALFTAAVVGTAAVIAHHDAHYHHWNCGCPHHWTDGRWTYYYEGGWEYYEPSTGVWYRYY
jgi:hypothetical protein